LSRSGAADAAGSSSQTSKRLQQTQAQVDDVSLLGLILSCSCSIEFY